MNRPLIAALLSAVLAICGCESASDPYLETVAQEEAAILHAETGADLPEIARIDWGDESWCNQSGINGSNVIFIDCTLKGDDDAVRCHVRHELEHLMDLRGDET